MNVLDMNEINLLREYLLKNISDEGYYGGMVRFGKAHVKIVDMNNNQQKKVTKKELENIFHFHKEKLRFCKSEEFGNKSNFFII